MTYLSITFCYILCETIKISAIAISPETAYYSLILQMRLEAIVNLLTVKSSLRSAHKMYSIWLCSIIPNSIYQSFMNLYNIQTIYATSIITELKKICISVLHTSSAFSSKTPFNICNIQVDLSYTHSCYISTRVYFQYKEHFHKLFH